LSTSPFLKAVHSDLVLLTQEQIWETEAF